ncbi:tetratricopeptide repeat protein [Pajaroellobacter abortibovis]|uniref:Tetratricopeptide repeat protein n=1 Tax=Pajaroellobacter abortibovis TaxID=1882918 RepID=A0A1L6MZP2_9BACT|nr:hypothetical protein [Pajaroellobacter abortibovis]APS00970.1 hypothetical protein BCY86_08465 [Pajaroellobacter abortibovis]
MAQASNGSGRVPIDRSSEQQNRGVNLSGSAVILAPPSSFPQGIPENAMILLPLGSNGELIQERLAQGPIALTTEEMWKLLGFNGPAVQVQDEHGRPVVIGLEDLLQSLEKHWTEATQEIGRGRVLANELMKYGRHEKAEQVLASVVAHGGEGEDWLALGVSQLNQKKLEKAEGTLRGAQSLLSTNPFPSLHLARLAREKKDSAAEQEHVERAIQIEKQSVDAWAYLATLFRERHGEEEGDQKILERAQADEYAQTSAPYIALQGFYANQEATRNKAIVYAEMAVKRTPQDPLSLLCLSALYGQSGQLESIITLLEPHQSIMLHDTRIAHNYFEALFRTRKFDQLKVFLAHLTTSPHEAIKQFAAQRTSAVAQFLEQEQRPTSKS